MMRRNSAFAGMFFVFSLLATAAGSALADVTKLAAGDAFPLVDAQSLSGNVVRLPADERGRPFVAIFGFSRGSGDQIARWSHALHARLPQSVAVYAVADLSHVPGLFRGFAVGGIRKQASPLHAEHDRFVILLTKSNSWQDLVPSGGEDDAVVVAVDASANVLEIERVPYADAEAQRVAGLFERLDATAK